MKNLRWAWWRALLCGAGVLITCGIGCGAALAHGDGPAVTLLTGPASVSPTGVASFSFPGPDPTMRYAYSVDGGRLSRYSERGDGISVRGLGNGRHVVRLRARMGSSRPGPLLVDHFRVDTSPPQTRWRGAWANHHGPVTSAASLAFQSSVAGSTYECSIDGAGFTACPSATSLSDLAAGRHVIRVRAVSPAGVVDPTPLRRVVEIMSPLSALVDPPGLQAEAHGDAVAAQSSAVFSDGFESGSLSNWMVKTAGGGTATVQSSVVDSGSYAAEFATSATSGSDAYARYTLPSAVADATLSENARVDVQGASGGNVPLARIFDASGNRIVNVYRQNVTGKIGIQLNGGSFTVTSMTMPLATWTTLSLRVAGSTVQLSVNGTSAYTTSSASVAAVDTLQIGNEVPAQAGTLYVDNVSLVNNASNTTPPDTTITSGTPGDGSAVSITFASNEAGVSYQCSLDSAPWAACTSPENLTGLANGSHTFNVRAVDSSGNVDPMPASVTWTTTAAGTPALLLADSKRQTLYIISYSGQVLWSWHNPLNQNSPGAGPLGVQWLSNGDILATFGTGTVGEINPTTKTFVWTTVGDKSTTGYFVSPYGAAIMPDGNLLVSTEGGGPQGSGQVVAFNRITGVVSWEQGALFAHGVTVISPSSPGALSPYPTILFGFGSLNEEVYDPGGAANYQSVFSYSTNAPYHVTALDTDGNFLAGTEPDSVAKITRPGGQILWTTTLGTSTGDEVRGIAVLPNGGYVVTHDNPSGGGQLYFLANGTGAVTGKVAHLSNGDELEVPYQIQSIPNYTGN